MNPDTVSMTKSLLEKPLNLLTEDDIAQITREECRRFLKDRGMRRPSWNKSQAIQQVISLKALLEDRTDPGDHSAAVRIWRKPRISPPPHFSLPLPTENASGSGGSREKIHSPYRRIDPISPHFTSGGVQYFLPTDEKSQHPQQSHFRPSRAFADGPLGQLSIFYDGKVNVYDGVPSAKAREIMQLAANPETFDPTSIAPISSGLSFLNRFSPAFAGPIWAGKSAGDPSCPNPPAGKLQRSLKDSVDEGRTSREPTPECPTSRNASLKRYLEKRKDRRYKKRRIMEGSSSSSVELMYLSQKISGPGQNELSSRSNSSSSMQPRPPYPPLSRCPSVETKKLGFSVDLNDDGAGGN